MSLKYSAKHERRKHGKAAARTPSVLLSKAVIEEDELLYIFFLVGRASLGV